MTKRITIVCGFPRCGSSLLMNMLHVGGMDVVADNYSSYEEERTLELPLRSDWIAECSGKAIKVLEPHQNKLPDSYPYQFIWLNRNPLEQAKSQMALLEAIGVQGLINAAPKAAVRTLADSIRRDQPKVLRLLRSYSNSQLIELSFETLVTRPEVVVARLSRLYPFLIGSRMLTVVERRSPKCQGLRIEVQKIRQEIAAEQAVKEVEGDAA